VIPLIQAAGEEETALRSRYAEVELGRKPQLVSQVGAYFADDVVHASVGIFVLPGDVQLTLDLFSQ
jgi:hypothetical protein